MSFSWQNLKKPIIGMSPMDGITDFPYRQIHAVKGKPDVIFTEFTHVEGIWHGRPQVLDNFLYNHQQRPIIAQIYGNEPDYFYKAAIICCELGFDGIDINMGCPAKNVTHSGGGAALIAAPECAAQIIKTVKQAASDWQNGYNLEKLSLPQEKIKKIKQIYAFSTINISQELYAIPFEQLLSELPNLETPKKHIPVSVKTRLGIEKPQTEQWITHLIKQSPDNITLHGRTLKQMYTGNADWQEIAKAASLIKQTAITFLANGDVTALDDALKKIDQTTVDGVLIGRASMGNPWIWQNQQQLYTKDQKLTDALEHAKLHWWSRPPQLFTHMRKHFGFYSKDFPGALEIRKQLITTSSLDEVEQIIKNELSQILSE